MIKLYTQLIKQLLLLSIYFTLFLPALSNADVDDGLQAYNKGDYTTARLEWMTAAEQGDPIALYNLGQLYRLGRGTFIDYFKAGDYYQMAARQGHVGAQRNLGFLYYHGRLGRAQRNQAFSWLSRAAAQGDPDSQWSVGTMLYNGDLVEADPIKAYAWYWLATENGHENGLYALAALDKKLTPQQIKAGRMLAPTLLKTKSAPIAESKQVKAPVNKPIPPQDQTKQVIKAAPIQKQAVENAPPKITTKKMAVKPKTVTHTKTVEDNFRVQLAALRLQNEVDKTWDKLNSKIIKLIKPYQRHTVVSDAGTKGAYYRLQLSPFETPEQAKDFCNLLKQNDQACFVNQTAGVK